MPLWMSNISKEGTSSNSLCFTDQILPQPTDKLGHDCARAAIRKLAEPTMELDTDSLCFAKVRRGACEVISDLTYQIPKYLSYQVLHHSKIPTFIFQLTMLNEQDFLCLPIGFPFMSLQCLAQEGCLIGALACYLHCLLT